MIRRFNNEWESIVEFLTIVKDKGIGYEYSEIVCGCDYNELFIRDAQYKNILRETNTDEIEIIYNNTQINELIKKHKFSQDAAINHLEEQKRDYEMLYTYFVKNFALQLKSDIERNKDSEYYKQLREIKFGDFDATSVLVNNWFNCFLRLCYEFQLELHLRQTFHIFWKQYEYYCLRNAYKQIRKLHNDLKSDLELPISNYIALNKSRANDVELPDAYVEACEKYNCTKPTHLQISTIVGYSKSKVQRELSDPAIILAIRKELQKKMNMAKTDETIKVWNDRYAAVGDFVNKITRKREIPSSDHLEEI